MSVGVSVGFDADDFIDEIINNPALREAVTPRRGVVMQENTNNENLNSAAYIDVDIGRNILNTNGWTVDNDGRVLMPDRITAVFVSASVAYESNGDRPALVGQIAINGNPVGAMFDHGYIRGTSGHESASLTFSEQWFAVNPGDEIKVIVRRNTNIASAVNQVPGGSHLLIKEDMGY